MSEVHEQSNASIRNHTGFAMAAAVIPVPVADVGAITAVEIDMLRALTKIYGLQWHEGIGRQAVGIAMALTVGSAIWASVLKFVPGIGSVIGGMVQMGVAGSICYALGKAYQLHLETGGETFNADAFKSSINAFLAEGKKVADEVKNDVNDGKYKQ